jgi:hypothetical protein
MSDYPEFLSRCLDCGTIVDSSSAIAHTCTANYYNDTYGD